MSKRKILIAEDEKYTRNTLSFVLENAGYHVVEAMNGLEALHLILQMKQSGHPFDLLILDIEMSGFTGWQILDELQRHQAFIPTIVITGLIDEQMLQRIRNNGGLECLKKPFEPKEFTAYVSRALKEQTQLKEKSN
jgi:CheY-like chemotaxis protein